MMFALPPDEPELGDLQDLTEAIDDLCKVLDADRQVVIEGLTEIIRQRGLFEELQASKRD